MRLDRVPLPAARTQVQRRVVVTRIRGDERRTLQGHVGLRGGHGAAGGRRVAGGSHGRVVVAAGRGPTLAGGGAAVAGVAQQWGGGDFGAIHAGRRLHGGRHGRGGCRRRHLREVVVVRVRPGHRMVMVLRLLEVVRVVVLLVQLGDGRDLRFHAEEGHSVLPLDPVGPLGDGDSLSRVLLPLSVQTLETGSAGLDLNLARLHGQAAHGRGMQQEEGEVGHLGVARVVHEECVVRGALRPAHEARDPRRVHQAGSAFHEQTHFFSTKVQSKQKHGNWELTLKMRAALTAIQKHVGFHFPPSTLEIALTLNES